MTIPVQSCTVSLDSQLGNYAMWHAVKQMLPFLSRPFRDAGKGLRRALIGTEGRTIRWEDCIADTTNKFGDVMGALFVKTHFGGQAKIQVSPSVALYH